MIHLSNVVGFLSIAHHQAMHAACYTSMPYQGSPLNVHYLYFQNFSLFNPNG